MLRVSQIWSQKNERRPKRLHVSNAFVPALSAMAVCAQDCGRCALQGLQSILDSLWHAGVLQQLLHGITRRTVNHSGCGCQVLCFQRRQSLSKGHATVSQKLIRSIALIREATYSGYHMQSNPIATETIVHTSNETIIIHVIL